MKEYKHNGETFSVEDTSNCELKVSDEKNTLSITLNAGGPSVYKVSTVKGGWWWHTNSVEESIRRACDELVKARSSISKQAACADLSKFVENL